MRGLPFSPADEHLTPFEIYSSGATHQGYVRSANEDAWAYLPRERFYILADGMGGRKGGAIAANEALKVVCEEVKNAAIFQDTNPSIKIIKGALSAFIQKANAHVWQMAQKDPSLEGMGTTLCCLCVLKKTCLIANVGDSRIYRFRQGELDQLTHDDSLLADLMKFELVNEEEAKVFPLRHIITKSIGSLPTVDPALGFLDIQMGDIFLLCSDGLTNFVSHDKITAILKEMNTIQEGTDKLIQAALKAGGSDNITVILVQIEN